jgi:hypothetical protein
VTLDDARRELQRQSVERGFGGCLEDVSVALAEYGKHVSVSLQLGRTANKSVDLPAPISQEEFDSDQYERRLLVNC